MLWSDYWAEGFTLFRTIAYAFAVMTTRQVYWRTVNEHHFGEPTHQHEYI